jgi:hypothetical protein
MDKVQMAIGQLHAPPPPGGLGGPRVGLDAVEKMSISCRESHQPIPYSVYRLSYLG